MIRANGAITLAGRVAEPPAAVCWGELYRPLYAGLMYALNKPPQQSNFFLGTRVKSERGKGGR